MLKKKFLLSGLLAVISLALLNTCTGADLTEDDKLRVITKLTANMIEKQHYRQRPFDDKVSSQLFDEYFKTLDPNKLYFTEEDVRSFEPQRNLLVNQLRDGDSSFAFAVYKRFQERLEQYRKFAEETLKKPIDFTADDYLEADRRKLPRAANDAELLKLWNLKLKSDVLNYRLVKRSLELDDKNRKEKESKKNDKTAETAKSDDEVRAIRAMWERKTPEEKILQRLRDLKNVYDQRDKIDILSLYLMALAQLYGPHSGYLPPKADEDFEINMSLSLSGIGATLTSDDGYIRVVELVPGGPAALDGRLHPEDRIIAVAQEKGEPVDVIDMSVDNAVKLIRGPAGSKVTLTVLPGKKGRNAVPENFTITRAKVILKDSEAQSEIKELSRKDGSKFKVGVIWLPSFYMDFAAAFRGDPDFKSCTRDVEKILTDFKKDKVDAVIMDLRNNSGGSLPEAITMTGLFIKAGPVVQVRQSNRSIEVERDQDEKVVWDGPLMLLTNKFSASAAEIFAGAIKDYRRGLLVGDSRTFGKGTVLTMRPLEQLLGLVNRKFPAGSVRLETAMFFRVSGDSVQQLGIAPDIKLPSITEELEVGEMFSDNHLPWDSIPKQSYRIWDRTVDGKVADLKKKSDERMAQSPEYKKLNEQILRIRKQLAKKTVSLNEEKRWKEYLAEKELQDSLDDDENPAPKRSGRNNRNDGPDPVLDEAANIMLDFAAK